MTVEDAAWLRKKDDFSRINVAELDAVLKGLNLALKWGIRDITLCTDSATVLSWVTSIITAERRVKTKGASEMVVKRRLGTVRELLEEFKLNLHVQFVPSEKNKADVLTRVKKTWLSAPEDLTQVAMTSCAAELDLKEVHSLHHMGVDRTLYLARKVDPLVSREAVRRMVGSCDRCQSIDPAPVTHEAGEIRVQDTWKRLAVDVTHYRQLPYLTMVDCGPSRIAIWRELRAETAANVAEILDGIFLERGPVDELLLDNSTVFRSAVLKEMLDRWKVKRFFRAAYRPSGNGIVERHHRTIKAVAERGRISPLEAVFWYNMAPRSGQEEASVPQRAVFQYDWRHPCAEPQLEGEREGPDSIKVGDEVWVKPPHARCTTQWGKGWVTGIHSKNNISVDGMPRHVLDVRLVMELGDSEDCGDEQEGGVVEAVRPRRERRPPAWTRDFDMGQDD